MIDAHVHVWTAARLAGYEWMSDEMAAIRRSFSLDDLRQDAAAYELQGVILVQTCSSLDETRELLALPDADGVVAGVVGWVDLTDPDVGETLAELGAGPSGDRLVGIRHQAHDESDPRWLMRDDVLAGLRAVEAAGLVFDLLVRPRELPAALVLARTVPGLQLVVDHAAKPPISVGAIEHWATAMAPFAELEHVACKVSGLVTEADWARWKPDDLVPVVDRLLGWFGVERLLFGSDWPVCRLAASYKQVVEATAHAIGALAHSESERLFGANARQVYGL